MTASSDRLWKCFDCVVDGYHAGSCLVAMSEGLWEVLDIGASQYQRIQISPMHLAHPM